MPSTTENRPVSSETADRHRRMRPYSRQDRRDAKREIEFSLAETNPADLAVVKQAMEDIALGRDRSAPAGPLGQPSPLWYSEEEMRPGGLYDRDYAAWQAAWDSAHSAE